ncbi:MAG TPA: RNA 2',3'-cyclic phosphodiesterase [Candidatus Dormibacteraeota bacterium]|nr:RNA 2',3'-cyclic phosphodiesterase [Candidatus Dormibacteraeota bacterium]
METAQDPVGGRAETIRAFVGIGLPRTHRERLGGYLEACRAAAPDFRWVRAGNLHLTLRFLGPVDGARLEVLAASLRRLTIEPFALRLGGLGTFGRAAVVRVVWIGLVAGGTELARLAAAVEARCEEAGLPSEERPYNPHLTLARARQRRGARLPQLPPPPELEPWIGGAFGLYRSRPAPGGAAYTVLEEFAG